jgi:hypothetical protein
MSGYLVTRWACSATDPLLGTSVLIQFLRLHLYALIAILHLSRAAPQVNLHERLILTCFPQRGHFISMIPSVGVTLSQTRQPHSGQRFDARISILLNFIVLLPDVYDLIRPCQMLSAQQA